MPGLHEHFSRALHDKWVNDISSFCASSWGGGRGEGGGEKQAGQDKAVWKLAETVR